MVEELLTEAEAGDYTVAGSEPDVPADDMVSPSELRQHRRTLRLARKGEVGKAQKSAKPSAVVANATNSAVQQSSSTSHLRME